MAITEHDGRGRLESEQPLVMIFLRQAFYLQQLRLILVAVILNLVLIGVLVGMLVFFVKHPVEPVYFATDKVGRLMVEPSLSEPNLPLDQVAAWVVTAVESAFSYDYLNYRSQLQGAQKYFTENGWRHYLDGVESSNNLLALMQRKMIFVAQVVGPPKLLVQGILNGRYAWKFQLPLLVTYYVPPYDDKTKYANSLVATVIVIRQKLSSSDHGLGIVQIISSLASGTPTPELSTQGA